MPSFFKDFSVDKFMNNKPPSDYSFDTNQEIKQLTKIPMDKKFVQDKDDIEATFNKTAKSEGVELPKGLVSKLIGDSAPSISKLKKHFNRPRPKVLAKKSNIKLQDVELKSMQTPSYPSGHSAQGVLIGNVLADMFPKSASKFKKAGKDISYSRNVAKAHYKSDSKFGEDLGQAMYEHYKNNVSSPLKKKQKGGGTTKTCLPAAKIRSLSPSKKQELISAKKSAGAKGKYKRSSKTNVKGARKKGATLRDWFEKEDWRQVNDPSKKCGEK